MATTNKLLRVIGLLYKMQPEDVKALTDSLQERRRAAWRGAIRQELRVAGCGGDAQGPSGNDRRKLRDWSRRDARRIARTWDRDVERQLQKLYNENPRGNRHYYAKRMQEWARARSEWKEPQIALATESETRQYAKDRFWSENKLTEGGFIFTGPSPVCAECIEHFSAGIVDYRYVRRNPAPVHPNCPHEWERSRRRRLNCERAWRGA